MSRNILLGMTGSVASILYLKLIEQLRNIGNVNTILTNNSLSFVNIDMIKCKHHIQVYTDKDEWKHDIVRPTADNYYEDFSQVKWGKNDPILHIQLRDTASALVIAPCSANTLAKLANGICDNLLTSIARAWDFNRPIIIVPSMNSHMWYHQVTQEHIKKLKSWGYIIIDPQYKMLACKTLGMGAMAEIDDIVSAINKKLQWRFPLADKYSWDRARQVVSGIPIKGHPGSFLQKRTKHTHTGVDLYTTDKHSVFAIESGKVVGIENFTGKQQNTPWWEDTECVLIEGASGVICYGEITPFVKIGDNIQRGQYIAQVKRVLPFGKERPDIEGHSLSMLHIELYPHGTYEASDCKDSDPSSFNLLRDPTQYLIDSEFAPTTLLKG